MGSGVVRRSIGQELVGRFIHIIIRYKPIAVSTERGSGGSGRTAQSAATDVCLQNTEFLGSCFETVESKHLSNGVHKTGSVS